MRDEPKRTYPGKQREASCGVGITWIFRSIDHGWFQAHLVQVFVQNSQFLHCVQQQSDQTHRDKSSDYNLSAIFYSGWLGLAHCSCPGHRKQELRGMRSVASEKRHAQWGLVAISYPDPWSSKTSKILGRDWGARRGTIEVAGELNILSGCRRSGSVNIHRYSPPLRRIIVNLRWRVRLVCKETATETPLAHFPGLMWPLDVLTLGGCECLHDKYAEQFQL